MTNDRPDLRPLGVGEIVDAAIRVYRAHFPVLMRISLVVLGPIALIQIAGAVAMGPLDLMGLATADPDAPLDEVLGPILGAYAVLGIGSILSSLGTVVVQASSIAALAQAYQGESPDWQMSLRAGFRRFLPVLGALVVTWLVAGLGLLLCLIPGVLLYTMWSVAPAVVVAERSGPLTALRRSWNLVRGRLWPVLGAIVLAYILYFVASQIIGLAASTFAFADAAAGVVSFLPSVIATALVSVLAGPFLAALITIIYFDLRVRKEGYDLELMARDLRRMEDPRHPDTPGDDPFGLGRLGP